MYEGECVVLDEELAHVGQAASWREADRQLVRIAKRRAALDAEEARWIVVAQERGVHRELGYGTFREYLERRLGYSARTARERIRVAEKLRHLPELTAALARGETSYSAVRELTRDATPGNERALLDDAKGKTVRELEASDEVRTRKLTLELEPEVYARFVAMKREMQDETRSALDDSAIVTALLEGRAGPRHQLALTVCPTCEAATVDAGGEVIAVGPAAVAQARCDLAHVSHDGSVTKDIPAKVRRAVERRDHGRCRVPGCRASIGLHLHHLHERARLGADTADNLILLCAAHHTAHHAGRLRVVGERADRVSFEHADRRPYGREDNAALAIGALRQLGYAPAEARRAVETARGEHHELEPMIRAALRACCSIT